jgi:Type II secretion system (T2SS), protein M
MTGRDRLVVIGIAVLVLIAGGWLLVVSPERHQAAEAQAQVQSAHQQLESAQTQAASARTAQQRYAAAYSSVVGLGKAVPPTAEVPSLIYELEQASNLREVDFNSITTGTSGGSAGSAPAAGSAAAMAAAASGSFTQMPFTFVFKGSFEGLAHLLGEVEDFAQRSNTGAITVSGRLLTIQGAEITLENTGSSETVSHKVALSATITAAAYVLPPTQGLTGGATPVGPSGAQNTSSSTGTAASATPAVIKVTP